MSSWEKPLELMTPNERADASTDWQEVTTPEGRKSRSCFHSRRMVCEPSAGFTATRLRKYLSGVFLMKSRMAGRGRMKQERDPRPVILVLEAQSSTSRRPPVRRRASVPKPCSGNEPSRFLLDRINVHAGQDILAMIRAYFECRDIRPNIRASYVGHVMSAHGEVSNPTLLRQGSQIVFEGIYAIGSFSGWYKVPHNGAVELDNLKISIFGSHGQCNAGDVTGSLIAATGHCVMDWLRG